MTDHDTTTSYWLMSTAALLELRRSYRRMGAALDGVTRKHERQMTYRRLTEIERELIGRGLRLDERDARG